jgi:hypothetical protein
MIGVALAMGIVGAVSTPVSANEFGPISPFTGAPQEPISGDGATCAYAPLACHVSFALNSGPGSIGIDVPAGYEPGLTYVIQVDVTQAGQMRWGFQLTVLDELLEKAGSLASTDLDTQIQNLFAPRQYVTHTLGGTAAGQANANSWTFEWTAPDTDVGPVTFWAAGNAANNNALVTGDYIYTTSVTIPAPEPGALAAGLLALSTAAALARRRSGRPA